MVAACLEVINVNPNGRDFNYAASFHTELQYWSRVWSLFTIYIVLNIAFVLLIKETIQNKTVILCGITGITGLNNVFFFCFNIL